MMRSVLIPMILGLLILGIGVMNWMGNLSTLHAYHRQHVLPANRKKMGRVVGFGMMLIGLALILSSLTSWFGSAQSARIASWITLVLVFVGVAIDLYGIIRYNGSLFSLKTPKP